MVKVLHFFDFDQENATTSGQSLSVRILIFLFPGANAASSCEVASLGTLFCEVEDCVDKVVVLFS